MIKSNASPSYNSSLIKKKPVNWIHVFMLWQAGAKMRIHNVVFANKPKAVGTSTSLTQSFYANCCFPENSSFNKYK